MQPDDVDAIRNLPLFRDCTSETFEALIKISFLQRFPQGVLLISENDPADFLHVVLEGMVEMFGSSGGRETTLSFVRPVSTFILAAVLKDQVYLQSARTLARSRILMIPAQSVRQAMQQDQAFMLSIVSELATGYRRVVKELKNQKLRTSSERLANWLLAHGRAGLAARHDAGKPVAGLLRPARYRRAGGGQHHPLRGYECPYRFFAAQPADRRLEYINRSQECVLGACYCYPTKIHTIYIF